MNDLKSPIACVWEITNRCNFKCPHCRAFEYSCHENAECENEIIRQLVKNSIISVNISGGEPLLNPRVLDIIRKLSLNGIDVGISTNGYLYWSKAEELNAAGISFVQVSVDGPEEIHDKFRGKKGAYENAIKSLLVAKDLGHFTQMNTTITAVNYKYIFDNILLAEKIGVNRIFFRRIVSEGLAKNNDKLIPNKKDYFEVLKKLIVYKYNKNSSVHISIDDPIISILDKNRYSTSSVCCSAGITSLGIDSNGNVYPCIFARTNIGNLLENDLGEIWRESVILEKLRNRDISECGGCEYKYSCGGCRGASGLFEKDLMCPKEK